MSDETPTQVRWLIQPDMQDVLTIERASVCDPWTQEDFMSALRQTNCIGMVAEQHGVIVGHMIYTLHKSSLRLLNLAVLPDARRLGVGRSMIEWLIDKQTPQRRKRITLKIVETNLDGQLFFLACGFRARKVLHGQYDTTDADAYLMTYAIKTPTLIGG